MADAVDEVTLTEAIDFGLELMGANNDLR